MLRCEARGVILQTRSPDKALVADQWFHDSLTVIVVTWAIDHFLRAFGQTEPAQVRQCQEANSTLGLADQMIYLMERHVPRQT